MAVTADIETRNSTVPMEYNPKIQDQVQLTTLSAFSQFYGIWLGRILPLNKYVHNIIAGEKSDEGGGVGRKNVRMIHSFYYPIRFGMVWMEESLPGVHEAQ